PIFVALLGPRGASQMDICYFVCYMPAPRVKGLAFVPLRFAEIPIRSIERGCRVQVLVRDNNVDQALKALKKKMQREGIFREMKLRGHYEKAEAVRRARKLARKKLQREGLLPMKPKPVFGAGPGGERGGAGGGRGGPGGGSRGGMR